MYTHASKPARSEPAYRPHVLLVEDELTVAKGLEMVMDEEGYDVDMADTGQGALNKFRAKKFDLMVADLRLPDIDGMEVIERVRESRPETKVVIITGYPSVSTAVQAVKMGVSDYLRKPFTDDEFIAAVETALKDREKDSMEKLITLKRRRRGLFRGRRSFGFWTGPLKIKFLAGINGKRFRGPAGLPAVPYRQGRYCIGRSQLDPEECRGAYRRTAPVHLQASGTGGLVTALLAGDHGTSDA